jgi:hypothetical protein
MYSQSPREILINKTNDRKYFNIFTLLNFIQTAQNVHFNEKIEDKYRFESNNHSIGKEYPKY